MTPIVNGEQPVGAHRPGPQPPEDAKPVISRELIEEVCQILAAVSVRCNSTDPLLSSAAQNLLHDIQVALASHHAGSPDYRQETRPK